MSSTVISLNLPDPWVKLYRIRPRAFCGPGMPIKKAIVGAKHTTPIVSMENTDAQILLQGKEQGYGWTFALDQEEGNFSATLVNRDGVFVLFGSCTPL